jgi:predicted AAA+ superfamily ATPase
VSLDEYGPRALALEDPNLFLQRYPPPVTIDEVQHAPELLGRIKPVVDRSSQMGDFWLTGSQQFPLMQSVSESLAGRVGVINMIGLSRAEENGARVPAEAFRPDRVGSPGDESSFELLDVFERIVRGQMPRQAHADAPPMEQFWGAYLQTYIERDVRSLLNIANLAAFQRFLRVSAARVGQLLNYSDLARDTGIAVSTAREWLHLLETTHVVTLLRPYFKNLTKRQIKTPKLYFTDTGLVAYLTGWRSAETAASGAMAGALFECYVLAEILKSYWHRGREAPIWYFRTKEKKEVDLVIEEDGLLFPVEVKLTASPSRKHLTGISSLQATGASLGRAALVCLVRESVPLADAIDAVPIRLIA